MSHRTDDKAATLRGQGFEGDINAMTLAWLQRNGATSDQVTDAWMEMLLYQLAPQEQPNIHLNPDIEGGAASGPDDGNNPPDNFTIGFNTATSGPHAYGWECNPEEALGRTYIAYNIDQHPGMAVGTTWEYRALITSQSDLATNSFGFSGISGVSTEVLVDGVDPHSTGEVVGRITIEDTTFACQVRTGCGVSGNRAESYIVHNCSLRRVIEQADLDGMQRNDLWYDVLGRLGFEGNISDREKGFWAGTGALIRNLLTPDGDILLDNNGTPLKHGLDTELPMLFTDYWTCDYVREGGPIAITVTADDIDPEVNTSWQTLVEAQLPVPAGVYELTLNWEWGDTSSHPQGVLFRMTVNGTEIDNFHDTAEADVSNKIETKVRAIVQDEQGIVTIDFYGANGAAPADGYAEDIFISIKKLRDYIP